MPFKPDIPDLLKKFIMFSPSDKVIIRSCSVLEKVSFAEKNSVLNHEIEECRVFFLFTVFIVLVVVKKKSMILDNMPSKTSLDEVKKPRRNVHVKVSVPSLTDTNKKFDIKHDRGLKRIQTLPVFANSRSEIEESNEDDSDMDISPIEGGGINHPIEYVQNQLDQWLAEEEIGKNNY